MNNPFERLDLRLDKIENLLAELKEKPERTVSTTKMLDLLLTRKQVSARYGVSLVTIQKWRKRGDLPRPVIMGGRLYWKERDLEVHEDKNLKRR